MAKDRYDISYTTYRNTRLKPVSFRGEETPPLYIRMTFDRETIFFKSYYFDLFTRPRYDFLAMSVPRMEAMELDTIGRIIDRQIGDPQTRDPQTRDPQTPYPQTRDPQTPYFSLTDFLREYKRSTACMLDAFDRPFQVWLSSWLQKEGLPGLSALVRTGMEDNAAIRIWDDLERCIEPAILERLKDAAITKAPAYVPLATYVRRLAPKGPFCLPYVVWLDERYRIAAEDFFDDTFGFMRVDFDKLLHQARALLTQ